MTQTPIAETWATSHQAPLWVAVALYAVAHADPSTGNAPMTRGQLRAALAPMSDSAVISQAIARAVTAGWLAAGSSAYCLTLARPVIVDGS